jgi:hypothetical protein
MAVEYQISEAHNAKILWQAGMQDLQKSFKSLWKEKNLVRNV